MSKIALEGNASGTGTFTVAAPNSNSNYTLTLPTSTGTVVVTGGAQTIEFAAGSASTPSITFTGDTNTGIFSPGADTIAFAEGGAEAARFDSSGNLCVGSTAAGNAGALNVSVGLAGTTAGGIQLWSNTTSSHSIQWGDGTSSTDPYRGYIEYAHTGDSMRFATQSTERMRIDSSGNVGIGTSSPNISGGASGSTALTVSATSSQRNALIELKGTRTSGDLVSSYIRSFSNSGATPGVDLQFYRGATDTDGYLTISTSGTERARITSGGNFLLGTANSSIEQEPGFKYVASSTTPYTGIVVNTDSALTQWHYYNTNATNNGYRFYVQINGGIANYSGNNTNLSDVRTKTNIELAGSYLDKVCAIPVKTFNYKDEPVGEQKSLGVIAQDVEAIAPELVDKDGWKDPAPEGEEPLKSIYTTDLMFALMKSIQELKAELDTVKAELSALKGN